MVVELRKKAETKRVLRWTGDNLEELEQFVKCEDVLETVSGARVVDGITVDGFGVYIGGVELAIGDYVIEGSETDYYTCAKDELFKYYEDPSEESKLVHSVSARNHMPKDTRKYIKVHNESVEFKIQVGSVKDNGVNGVQAVDLIEFTRNLIAELNCSRYSADNSKTAQLLSLALGIQYERKFRIANPNVSTDILDALHADRKKLEALQDAGVDNWSGYDEAMKALEPKSDD